MPNPIDQAASIQADGRCSAVTYVGTQGAKMACKRCTHGDGPHAFDFTGEVLEPIQRDVDVTLKSWPNVFQSSFAFTIVLAFLTFLIVWFTR